MRPCDWNGHTPVEGDAEANPEQRDSTLLTGLAARFGVPGDPHERNIWLSGYFSALAVIAEANQARLDAVLARPA